MARGHKASARLTFVRTRVVKRSTPKPKTRAVSFSHEKGSTVENRQPSLDAFGGVTGRVLREAMSFQTMVTGLTLVISLGALGYIMSRFESGDAFMVLVQLATTVALARFALNGFCGEWSGTIFSGRGGTWYQVGVVALRFTALSCLWLIPLLILGWKPEEVGMAVAEMMMGEGGSKVVSLTALVTAFTALTPPVFLIASVSAARFSDLFDRNHWEGLFSGRKGELYLIYVVYLGALAMMAVICMPFLVAIGLQNSDMGTILGLFMLSFAGGLAVNLLGRLCGFFAASENGTEEWASPTSPVSPDLNDSVTESPLAPAPGAPPASAPIRASVTSAPRPAGEATVLNPSGKTPLLDARERVDELALRFSEDAEGTLAALRELNDVYAPHPLVLHQLCLLLDKASRPEESREVAEKALTVCLERGALRLASEIFAVHLEHSEEFGLPRDTVLALSDDLRRDGELTAAEDVYSRILSRDGGERRAVKGLLQIAEKYMDDTDYVHAREIYRFLMSRAGDSPLAVHIEQGLAEAERRLAKAS